MNTKTILTANAPFIMALLLVWLLGTAELASGRSVSLLSLLVLGLQSIYNALRFCNGHPRFRLLYTANGTALCLADLYLHLAG